MPINDHVIDMHASMGGKPKFRWILLAILPILIYLLLQSILSGVLYLNQYHLHVTLNHWNEKQSAVTLADWKKTEKQALALFAGHQDNASVVNAIGRLYSYRSMHMATNREERVAYGTKALGFYKTAIRLRPAWPYGWMNFAITKARMGSMDQEFTQALLRLLQLDPWSKKRLPVIVKLSLFAWPHLDRSARQSMMEYFVIAQEQRMMDVRKALNDSGGEGLYCRLMVDYGSKASFCP